MSPMTGGAVRLLAGAVLTFACYLMTHGHLLPGGGIAGGMLAAAAFAMAILALGAAENATGLAGSARRFAPLGLLLLVMLAVLGPRSGELPAHRGLPGDPAEELTLLGGGTALLGDLAMGLTVWMGTLAALAGLASSWRRDAGGPG